MRCDEPRMRSDELQRHGDTCQTPKNRDTSLTDWSPGLGATSQPSCAAYLSYRPCTAGRALLTLGRMRTCHQSIVTADRGRGNRLRKSPFGAGSARGRQRKADLCEEGTGPGSASGVVASTSWNTLNLFHGAGDDGRVEPENQTAKRRRRQRRESQGASSGHRRTRGGPTAGTRAIQRGWIFARVLPRYVVRVSFTSSVVDLYGIRR